MTFFGPGQTEDQLYPTTPGSASNDNLSRRLKLVTNAAPIFGEGEGLKYAQQFAESSMDDKQLIQTAQTAASDILVRGYQKHLESIEDPWKQLQTYNQFDEGQKRLLHKIGYVPPENARDPGPKGLGIVTNILGKSLGGVAKAIDALPGGSPLKGLETLAGYGTHLYRAARLGVEEEGLLGIGGMLSDAEIDERRATPLAVARDMRGLWHRTEKGEENFSLKSVERVRKSIGDVDQFEFVQALAGGKTITDYVTEDLKVDANSPLFEQQLSKYSQYQQQESVQDAVADLRNNMISPGRDLADLVTPFKRGSTPFNIASGGIDATFRIMTDPTLHAGSMLKSLRIAKYGLDPMLFEGKYAAQLANRIDYLSTVPRFRAAAEHIAIRFGEGKSSWLIDELPQMRGGGLESFNNWLYASDIARDSITSDVVFDFFKSKAGAAALSSGEFAAPHFPGTILPSLTRVEAAKTAAGLAFKDFNAATFQLADYGFDVLKPEQLKELFGLKGRAAIDIRQGVGNAIHSFYTKVPKYDFMGPDDKNAVDTFRSLLDYSLPQYMRDDFVEDWLSTTNFAARRQVYESGVQAMFHYSGALATDKGEQLMAKALGKGQVYAADALDQIKGRAVGIGEADLASYWAIPDFKEMLKATSQTTMFRRNLDHFSEGYTERFFANYWKPAVLLKAGFIPRAYGEEYLGFMLREGPKAWVNAQAAITATKEGYLLPMRPVGWLADSLLSHIPLTFRDNPIEVYAHNFANATTRYARDWAEKLAPEEYLAAARSLAEYGGGIHGAVGQLGTTLGVVGREPARLTNETIGRIDPATKNVTEVPIRRGEVTLHGKDSAFHAHTVLKEMRRMQTDRLFAPLMDAGTRQFAQDEGEEIVSKFVEAGLIGEGGPTYTVGMRRMRQLVPNKVMPNFEAMLKHDSYASFDSVVDDLVQAGVDQETAVTLTGAIKGLEPRQRMAIFTRDGELERLYQPHVLDPDAAFDVDSSLPSTRQAFEDEALREYHSVLEDLWGPADSGDAYWRISRKRLNAADMQNTVRRSYRTTHTLDNREVAAPPARGTRRVYTLVMDHEPALTGGALKENVPELANVNSVIDSASGYVPLKSSEINNLIPEYQPNINPLEIGEGELTNAEEMAWFSQDYAHAESMYNRLKVKYGDGQPLSIGYVDVPEDVFQTGRNLAKSNAAGGVDPLALENQANQVWIPKSYRDNYQVLRQDNYQIVYAELHEVKERQYDLMEKIDSLERQGQDPAALRTKLAELQQEEGDIQAAIDAGTVKGIPAVGATQDEALGDWAHTLQARYRQVFESENNLATRDLQHKLLTNKATINDIVDHGKYLNDYAVGAQVIEPERENWVKAITQKGFDVVGAGGNAMIRNQMFLHHYAKRLASETRKMAEILGETGATATIEEFANRLGTTHYQLASDWRSLEDDIRGAANPYEAMIARDPIPPSLRSVIDVDDQKAFAEAWTAFYDHKNPDLLEEAEQRFVDNYVKTGQIKDYSFRDLQDSYLSLDKDMRDSIRKNGYKDQFPKAFESSHQMGADDWTKLRDALETNKHVYKVAHDTAMRAAVNDVIPWIDDYRIRSQFQQHGRNFIPFWFSQENFIKRVANNVYRDPAAIRKAQVLMNALHNTGVVTQNQYGEDVYNIPLTGALVKTVTKLVEWGPGDFKLSLPVVNPMTGQLKYTIPGLDTFDRIGPSVSPLAGIPLQAITKIFPELDSAKRAIIGERGVTDPNGFDLVMKSLVPSYAYRMFEAVSKDINSDSEYASATLATAQMLEEAGHGLPENAEPYEYDDYMDRLQNFTRMQMFLRGVVGFFSPAAPSTTPTEEFSPELQALMRKMPLEEAMLQFMTENPTARAYTIFKTEVPSKAPISASEATGKMLDEHSEYFDKYKMAGPWLLPQSQDDTGFSNAVYNQEIARELRRRKSVKEWYDDYYFASAATDYFDTKEDYDLRMAAAKGNPQLRAQLTEGYQAWKDNYLNDHKVFAKLLNDGDAAKRRQEVLDQMDSALNDPDAPDAPHKQALTDLVDTYKDYLSKKKQYRRNTNFERQAKQNLTDGFTIWVKQHVDKNPGTRAFYDRIIRPEMGIEE